MVPKSVMRNANQMNGLYPIIRRVRRPLLPVEVPRNGQPADAKPAMAPVSTEQETGSVFGKAEDGETTSEQRSE